MSTTSSKIFRGTVFALLLSVAPVASAVGQEAGSPGAAAARPVVVQTASVASEAGVAQPTIPERAGGSVIGHAETNSAEVGGGNALEGEAGSLRPGQFLWGAGRAGGRGGDG